jgi:prepilin-type N-terminal cleavage/methylation domain-containing protein
MANKFCRGFSLIELMIAVAIIGILSAIAIPSYNHYTQKARFAEVITSVQPYKLSIALALQEGKQLNELLQGSNGIPIFDVATQNVESITVINGVINALATQAAGAYTFTLTPNALGTQWQTGGSCKVAGVC